MRDDQYARREAFTPSVKLFGCLLSVSMMVALSATRRPANVAAVVRVTVPQVAGCALFHALNRGRPAVVAGVWRWKPEEQRKHICPSASTASPTPSSRELLSAWRWRHLPFH
jgi:hypothetical protein